MWEVFLTVHHLLQYLLMLLLLYLLMKYQVLALSYKDGWKFVMKVVAEGSFSTSHTLSNIINRSWIKRTYISFGCPSAIRHYKLDHKTSITGTNNSTKTRGIHVLVKLWDSDREVFFMDFHTMSNFYFLMVNQTFMLAILNSPDLIQIYWILEFQRPCVK